MNPGRFEPEDLSPDELERQAGLFGPLTQSVRELVDALVRTEVLDEDELRTAQLEIEAITARLRKSQLDGGFGLRYDETGVTRCWGNAVIGLRNAVAPPVDIHSDAEGRHWADFHLGAAYEGPPGLVHGGVTAMVLDHICGQTASRGGKPRMTAYLTTHYRRGTPLGDLRVEARVDRVEDHKTYVVGRIMDAEGVTVEAEGLFVLPRWARD